MSTTPRSAQAAPGPAAWYAAAMVRALSSSRARQFVLCTLTYDLEDVSAPTDPPAVRRLRLRVGMTPLTGPWRCDELFLRMLFDDPRVEVLDAEPSEPTAPRAAREHGSTSISGLRSNSVGWFMRGLGGVLPAEVSLLIRVGVPHDLDLLNGAVRLEMPVFARRLFIRRRTHARTASPDEFSLALPQHLRKSHGAEVSADSPARTAQSPAQGDDDRSHSAGSDTRPPIRVFVSYAHDDKQHVESVLAFCEFLLRCGFDVQMDRWDLARRRDWYQWIVRQIRATDFVLVVASPACRRVGNGDIENTQHRGLQTELALLRELLQGDRARWLTRILPVVLPDGSVDDIPLFLQPQTADHYRVHGFDIAGAEDLLRTLSSQPPFERPTVPSQLVKLPPQPSTLDPSTPPVSSADAD
jgi:SEFIR domain